MKQSVVFGITLMLAAACARGTGKAPAAAAQASAAEMRTIENVDPRVAALDPPPMLNDEAPPPKPKGMPWEQPKVVVMTPEDEKLRAALPFSPAIAMDPIDGSKISIRASTPTFEYKGRIYYFSSEANRNAFQASPDQFLTGKFTRL